MLLVGDAIYQILKADAGVTALVGTRIYPGPMPQNAAFPAIVRWMTDRQEIPILEAPGASNLVRYEYRMIATAKGNVPETVANQVFRAMNKCFRNFSNSIISNGAVPPDTIWIAGIANARALSDLYNQETMVWEVGATYDIWAHEPLI